MFTVYSFFIAPIMTIFVGQWLYQRIVKSNGASKARRLAIEKRAARDKKREQLLEHLRGKLKQSSIDRQRAEKIGQSTATELIEALKNHEITYTEVALVLSIRALKVGQQLNCTTEEFFDETLSLAEELDRNGSKDLLLSGIPVSIKDQINQKGADSSMGLSMRNFRPSTNDGLLICLLKAQGALPGFVRTATIQGMMLPESDSATYGTVLNPYDQRRSAGGSSGGEGALVSAAGSPVGIGTDIGGSIRIPAHFNGIFGLKPTPGRITYKGVASPAIRGADGQTIIRSTAGPLARCVDDLILVMKTFLQEMMWLEDPALARQPWREERFQEKKKLTIGYIIDDHWFPPAPACRRAVEEAAQHLRNLGHTLRPYEPINISEGVRLFASLIQADGSQHFIESFENEEPNILYSELMRSMQLPKFLRPFIARILCLLGESRNATIVKSGGAKSAYDYYEMIIDFKKYVQSWLDDMKKNDIDLLLSPVNGLPAYKHGLSRNLFHSCSYTFIWNVLHFPSGVVPLTVVREDEQYYEDKEHSARDRVVKFAKEVCRESAGLPVSVQVIGWPNDDERVLRIMKELENSIGLESFPRPKLAFDINIFDD